MEDGAIRNTVKQMEEWTVLHQAFGSTSTRAVYGFSAAWQPDLDDAMRHHTPTDLIEGQRLLLVASAETPDDPRVAWLVEFERQKTSLLALLDSSSPADAAAIQQLVVGSGGQANIYEVTARRAMADD